MCFPISVDVTTRCGNNSEMSSCVSQCEPSCDDPDGSKCKEDLEIGSVCEEGSLLSVTVFSRMVNI